MKDSRFWKAFSGYYLWITEAKVTACMFFVYCAFMYMLLGWVTGAATALGFMHMLQMFILCSVVGILQRIILPSHKVTVAKSLVWSVFSTVISLATAIAFNWFAGFPLWCQVVFWGILIVGFVFMAAHLYLTTSTETRELNDRLQKFQQHPPGQERGNT